jgi:hypothetical protein
MEYKDIMSARARRGEVRVLDTVGRSVPPMGCKCVCARGDHVVAMMHGAVRRRAGSVITADDCDGDEATDMGWDGWYAPQLGRNELAPSPPLCSIDKLQQQHGANPNIPAYRPTPAPCLFPGSSAINPNLIPIS